MPARGRSDSDEALSQLITTVVDIAAKSAESATAVAKSLQSLETTFQASRDKTDSEIALIKTELGALKSKIEQMEKKIGDSNENYGAALKAAVQDPRTIIMVLTLLAGLLGIRVSQPTNLPVVDGLPAVSQPQGPSAP